MGQYVDFYCGNQMRELKKIVDPILYSKFAWIPQQEYDDFYSIASIVVWDCEKKFDCERVKTKKFKSFLSGCIHKKIKTRVTYMNRDKRMLKDDDGNPIHNCSFDAPIGEDEIDLKEKIDSGFSVEDEVGINFEEDEKIDQFLNNLPKKHRDILKLKMEEMSVDKIKQTLNVSDKEYNSVMKSLQMNENLSLFTKNINDCDYKEGIEMERVMEINESENYRMDKYSMFALLEDKKLGDINCKYILQRKPFQWTQEERNRYICRILSNLPIPEIILCEQNVKGMMISHLIDGLQRLSYAEAFKENRFKIGANGAERHLIQYRDYILDENGQRVLDEDGIPIFEMKVCDVVGKHYKDLPDELKKRFNNFNINVTKFFNCTDEQIADHIRDYNNHASMNNEQLGITKISADTARKIKAISEKNTFFKNCGKFTDTNAIKGKLDRVVAESIMLLFHRENWKSKIDKAYQFVNENVTDEEFLGLNSDLNRLELALGADNKEVKQMFTVTDTPMWVAVFHEFTTYNIEDEKFVEFMIAYKDELSLKEVDGISMKDFKDKQSKKKTTITGKIDLLVKLMKEFLHINEEDMEEINILEFVRENVKSDVTEEDVELYEDILDELTLEVDNNTKLLDEHNRPSLIALVGYACEEDKDGYLEEWTKDYFAKNSTYQLNQTENYLHIKEEFESLVKNAA